MSLDKIETIMRHQGRIRRELTKRDKELARRLFATERFGDATINPADPTPALYERLAHQLRNVTNREIIRDLLEEPVE